MSIGLDKEIDLIKKKFAKPFYINNFWRLTDRPTDWQNE